MYVTLLRTAIDALRPHWFDAGSKLQAVRQPQPRIVLAHWCTFAAFLHHMAYFE